MVTSVLWRGLPGVFNNAGDHGRIFKIVNTNSSEGANYSAVPPRAATWITDGSRMKNVSILLQTGTMKKVSYGIFASYTDQPVNEGTDAQLEFKGTDAQLEFKGTDAQLEFKGTDAQLEIEGTNAQPENDNDEVDLLISIAIAFFTSSSRVPKFELLIRGIILYIKIFAKQLIAKILPK